MWSLLWPLLWPLFLLRLSFWLSLSHSHGSLFCPVPHSTDRYELLGRIDPTHAPTRDDTPWLVAAGRYTEMRSCFVFLELMAIQFLV